MVDYSKVYEAFLQYAASGNQSDWCELWISCTHRMEALVKTKAKKLKVPLPEGDISDIVTDSTCRVMRVLRYAHDVDEGFISKTFWNQNLASFKTYNRRMGKVRRDEKIAKVLNERFFLN